MVTYFDELTTSRIVCVPFNMVDAFVTYCREMGVIPCGGAIIPTFGQFFYID